MVCRELGFKDAAVIYSSPTNDGGTTWINNLQCNGDETSLVSCVHDGWKNHSCTSARQAGVICNVPEGRPVPKVCLEETFMLTFIALIVDNPVDQK